MLDAEARTLLDQMDEAARNAAPTLNSLSYAAARAVVDKMLEDGEADPPQVAAVEGGGLDGPAGKIRYRRYRPLGLPSGPLPTLVYFHGGGFVAGSLETHDTTCRRIANKSRCQVMAIDYRLAPEHPFPAATDDGIAAFRRIRDNAAAYDADPSRLAVGGDSAGGAIAAVICHQARSTGEVMPAFQMLIYPATDLSRESQSHREFADGYFLDGAKIEWFSKAYLPEGVDLTDPRLSPLLAQSFEGLPPAFVLTAGYDRLRDEGRAYANRLIDAGVKTTYVNYPGTIHGFFSMTQHLRQGLKANEEAAAVMGAFFER